MPIVSPKVVAEHLGVTPQRIAQLANQGMPREGYGKYDLEACLEWAQRAHPNTMRQSVSDGAGDTSLAEARIALLEVQTEAAHYKLACDRGEYTENGAVLAATSNIVTAIVTALDTWVDSAPDAETMAQRRECAWLCRERIGGAVESVCADAAGVESDRAAGLRNTRQIR